MTEKGTTDQKPNRRHPALHLPNLDNQGTIIFVTANAKVRRNQFCDQKIHNVFQHAWSDATYWQVGEYVIMPDHVHLFARPRHPGKYGLRLWVAWWKRSVARELHMAVWQRHIWDVRLRSADRYAAAREYVRQNPVRAGLAKTSDDWPYRGKIHDLTWD